MKLANAMLESGTNLYTRRYFDKIFKTFITESQRERKYFSLLLISIDNFKTIHDKYGHSIGNKIFSNATKISKQSVRRIDLCFRYDGDEIAIILPNALKEVARIYMKCLARLGRVKTVKVLYKSLKHTLHKELHHTPSQETEDLYLSIVDSRAPV